MKDYIEGNDLIEESVTNAASVLADETYKQNGMAYIADDHDDDWFDLRDEIRSAMLTAAVNAIKEHIER